MPSAFDQLRHQIHIIATADVFRESPRRAYDPAVADVAVSRRSSHGRDEAEDARLEKQMLSDAKERAEHVMLVDLGRNDLGRVSEYGSVKVRDLMYVERYSHVIHTVSC